MLARSTERCAKVRFRTMAFRVSRSHRRSCNGGADANGMIKPPWIHNRLPCYFLPLPLPTNLCESLYILTPFMKWGAGSGIDECTLYDLCRTVITNWAKKLLIQVVQILAGHSDMATTRKYCLAVRPEDRALAKDLVNEILARTPRDWHQTDTFRWHLAFLEGWKICKSVVRLIY